MGICMVWSSWRQRGRDTSENKNVFCWLVLRKFYLIIAENSLVSISVAALVAKRVSMWSLQ